MVVCLSEGWEIRGQDCVGNCYYRREASEDCEAPGLDLVSIISSPGVSLGGKTRRKHAH